MKINRAAHIPWAIFVLIVTAAAASLYVANFHPQRMPFAFTLPPFFGETPPSHATIGGTPLGLIFGSISLAIFIFAALLGVRKKIARWRVGHVQRWLRAHIWLTLLTIPLVLLHSGFHIGGPMTTLLMMLYAIVMVSGIYGLALQQQMPRLMKERLPEERVYEQIPEIRAQLRAAAAGLYRSYTARPALNVDSSARSESTAEAIANGSMPVASGHAQLTATTPHAATIVESSAGDAPNATASRTGGEPREIEAATPLVDPASETVLAEFLRNQVVPYLEARRGKKFRLGNAQQAEETFRYLRLRVADAYRPRIDEIQSWCDERRLLDLQTRMQHWLHGWLFIHVPLSFLLLLLTFWHAYVTLFLY